MRLRRWTAATVLVALGCTQQEEPEPTPSTTPIRVALIGDSIAESFDVECDVACKLCGRLNGETCTVSGEYTSELAASTDTDVNVGTTPGDGAVYTGDAYEVVNFGDSGDQMTIEIAARYCRQVVAADPDFDVMVSIAAHNDLSNGAGAPGQEGSNGEEGIFIWSGAREASYLSMVENVCAHGTDVVLVSVPPWQGGAGWTPSKIAETIALNGMMEEYVRTATNDVCLHRFVDLWQTMDEDGDNICDHCPDGTHPDDVGDAQISDAVFAQFDREMVSR